MKKYLTILAAFFLITACRTRQDEALKSADKEFILKVAQENFDAKKWKNALALYERATNFVAGTDDFPNVAFNTAYANYYDRNYKLAGHQFKNFAVNFSQDPRREEAAYMSAICYYQSSMDYNLDQSGTELALNELQDFINNYPNSERSKNINKLIEELSYKLEFKSYENARQYYKMADYKAATTAFENVLEDFPATKLRPKIYDYILKSRYQLAVNSIYDLKKDRLESALAYARQVEKELPDTDYATQAADLRKKLETEKASFAKIQAEVEAAKAKSSAKQPAAEAEKKQNKARAAEDTSNIEIHRDSAATVAPEPAATFKIRR